MSHFSRRKSPWENAGNQPLQNVSIQFFVKCLDKNFSRSDEFFKKNIETKHALMWKNVTLVQSTEYVLESR